jgi:hypothetical protein
VRVRVFGKIGWVDEDDISAGELCPAVYSLN